MKIRFSFWKSEDTGRPLNLHTLAGMYWVESASAHVERDAIVTAQQWFAKKNKVKNWKEAADSMTYAKFDEDDLSTLTNRVNYQS